MLSELKRAYYAGLFDGEGCVTIAKQSLGRGQRGYGLAVRVSVQMCDPAPLQQLQQDCGGGKLYWHGRKEPQHRALYGWVVTARQAEAFLTAIRPYVYLKGEQIDLALEFRRRVKLCAGHVTMEERGIRLELRERLQALKTLVVFGAMHGIRANSGNPEMGTAELNAPVQGAKSVETKRPTEQTACFEDIVHPDGNATVGTGACRSIPIGSSTRTRTSRLARRLPTERWMR